MKKVLLVVVLTVTLGVLLGSVFATDSSAFGFGRRGVATWYGMGWWGMYPYWGWYGCAPVFSDLLGVARAHRACR